MNDLARFMLSSGSQLGDGRVFRPPLPAGYVPRPRLCERLNAGLSGRLLLITAPAGFGKSSLASEFCEQLPTPWQSLWLSLSDRDSDPGRFLERLLAALRQRHPQLGDAALAMLKLRQRHQPFAYEECLDAVLDELSEQARADQPLLLVLDDYHLAQGAVLDRCLQFLLNHLPAGLLLLVTSRQRPDWHLARLRLSRQILELSEQDLRLTTEEGRGLLGGHVANLGAADLEQLLQRCEGWVAGLRLWLLTREEGQELACSGSPYAGDGLIHDYLLEEVLERLPVAVQQFLYETACLERFCADLCDALRDAHDSAAIIQHLRAHQVFLVPLDEQGHWFRFHHLFSDLLRTRPAPALGIAAAGLHLRACRWFSGRGLFDEAIEHALRAARPDVAASLVQNLSEEQLLAEQNVAMLLRWKRDLPDSLVSSSARLVVLYGWVLALACQLDAAQDLLGQLQRYLPAPTAQEHTSLLAQWLALSGVIARARGDRPTAEHYCTVALGSLSEANFGQRLMCQSTLANLAVAGGDLWRARGLNRDALELAQRIGNPLFEAFAHYDRARVLQARGEIVRAEEAVEQGLHCLQALPATRVYAVRARLRIYQGYLLTLRLQAPAAAEALREGVREARACRDVSLLAGYCVLASLHAREGRLSEGFAELAEAERLMHIWDVPPVIYLAMITLVKCELWLGQGQLELADAWLQRMAQSYGNEQTAPPEFHPQLLLHVALLRAALARLQGHAGEAERQLRALIQQAQAAGATLMAVMAQAQLAMLMRVTEREREAQQTLAASLMAAAGGALLPFQEIIRHQPQWLGEQLALCSSPALRGALQAQLPLTGLPDTQPGSAEALSVRELSVLRLIAQGCSNQQISERLFISLHTVKTHARHINSKLGVERRTQAVARAKALGLLG